MKILDTLMTINPLYVIGGVLLFGFALLFYTGKKMIDTHDKEGRN